MFTLELKRNLELEQEISLYVILLSIITYILIAFVFVQNVEIIFKTLSYYADPVITLFLFSLLLIPFGYFKLLAYKYNLIKNTSTNRTLYNCIQRFEMDPDDFNWDSLN